MRIRPWCLLAGLAPLAVVVFSSRSPVRAGDKPPSDATTVPARQQLVGEWKLNPELSEDLAKMRAAREEGGRSGGWGGSRGGGWGGGGGGGHHGGHGGGYGGSGGGAPRGEGGGPARSMMLTASQITVTNVDPEVTILDPEGQIRRFHADDKAYKDDAGNEVKARWDGDRLVRDEGRAGRHEGDLDRRGRSPPPHGAPRDREAVRRHGLGQAGLRPRREIVTAIPQGTGTIGCTSTWARRHPE